MTYDLVIKNVYTTNTGNDIVNIGINGNKITKIDKAELKGKEVIDGKQMLAAPGWVNTHSHIAMTLLRSYADDMELMPWLQNKIWPIEAKFNDDHFKWGSYLGVLEMIKGGTTCFNDMYFFMHITAEAVAKSGMRGVLCRCVMGDDPKDDYRLQESEEFFEQWHNKADGRVKVTYGPHAIYTCTQRYLEKIIELANNRKGSLVHMHIAETEFEVETCKKEHKGLTPVQYLNSLKLFDLPVLAAHCVYLTPEDMDILAAKKVAVSHNPQSNLKLASGIAPITQMQEKNILVSVGTDGPSSNNNLDMLEDIRTASYLAKGSRRNPTVLPATEALKMGTYNGAQALRWENLGKLEENYLADIVLYRMDEPYWYPRHNMVSNLIYSATSNDVDTVIVDGKVLMKNREMLTLDEEQIKYETNKIAMELVK